MAYQYSAGPKEPCPQGSGHPLEKAGGSVVLAGRWEAQVEILFSDFG